MTISRPTPPWLHDMLGERFVPLELVLMLVFGASTATAVILALPAGTAAAWRLGLAGILAADIAAGCIANLTTSTNSYYAARPRKRWLFIAVHVHLPVFAWAVGADLRLSLVAWAYTIVAATLVNALAGRALQRVVGGACLACAMLWVPFLGLSAPVLAITLLFVAKVAFAFAVDHSLPARDPG